MTDDTTSMEAIPEGTDKANTTKQCHSCDDTEFTTENLLNVFEKKYYTTVL